MKLRLKVYDNTGSIHDELDLTIEDEANIELAVSDIHDFLIEQYSEIKELMEDEL